MLIAAGAFLAVGCATVSPEQDAQRQLLTRAAQDCQRRYPYVERFDFDRFDRLTWLYREGASQADRDRFSACYREQVIELARATSAAGSPEARSGGESSVPPDAWRDPPTWKVGNQWSYRWESSRGKGTFVWRVLAEEAVDNATCYLVDSGRYQIYFRKADFALVQEKDRTVLDLKYVPARRFLAWPLHVGRAWEVLYTQEVHRRGSTALRLGVWRVERKEQIAVPAGTFEAFKVVERDKWANAVVSQIWVAPKVKGLVKAEFHYDYGVEKRELTAYQVD